MNGKHEAVTAAVIAFACAACSGSSSGAGTPTTAGAGGSGAGAAGGGPGGSGAGATGGGAAGTPSAGGAAGGGGTLASTAGAAGAGASGGGAAGAAMGGGGTKADAGVSDLWTLVYAPPMSGPARLNLTANTVTVTQLDTGFADDNLYAVESANGHVYFAGTNHIAAYDAASQSMLAEVSTSDLTDMVALGADVIVVRYDTVERRHGNTLDVAIAHKQPQEIYTKACVLDGTLWVTATYFEGGTFKKGVVRYDAASLDRIDAIEVPGGGPDKVACGGGYVWATEFIGDHTYRITAGGAIATMNTAGAGRVFFAGGRVWVNTASTQAYLVVPDTMQVTPLGRYINSIAFPANGTKGWAATDHDVLTVDTDGQFGNSHPIAQNIDWLAYSGN